MEHETYNLIARYHAGKLTEAERAGFEERLRTDAAFAEEVAVWAAVYQGIQDEGDRLLDAKLGDLGRALWQKEDTGSPLQAVTPPKMTAKRGFIKTASAFVRQRVIALRKLETDLEASA